MYCRLPRSTSWLFAFPATISFLAVAERASDRQDSDQPGTHRGPL